MYNTHIKQYPLRNLFTLLSRQSYHEDKVKFKKTILKRFFFHVPQEATWAGKNTVHVHVHTAVHIHVHLYM